MEHVISFNEQAIARTHQIEAFLNRAIRGYDKIAGALRIGGRKGTYHDEKYELVGGSKDELRKKHYDKSMRLLWKAEQHAPWSSFRDLTDDEQAVLKQAFEKLSADEKLQLKKMRSGNFQKALNAAYAWMVSAELLAQCKSTGGRAAITMQMLEEAP